MAVSATHLEFDPFVFMFSGSYYEQVHLCSHYRSTTAGLFNNCNGGARGSVPAQVRYEAFLRVDKQF